MGTAWILGGASMGFSAGFSGGVHSRGQARRLGGTLGEEARSMVDLENTHNSPNTCPAPFRLRITNLTVNSDRIQSFLPRLAPGHELHRNGHGLGQTSAFGFRGSASRAQMCLELSATASTIPSKRPRHRRCEH